MSSLNLCQFIGNLARDPETRYMPDGSAVANFSIACDWKTKDKEGVEWVRVTMFGKTAEIAGKYLQKGSKAYVAGRLQTRKWKDKDGNERYTTEVVADQLLLLSPKGEAAEEAKPDRGGVADMQDDIPF